MSLIIKHLAKHFGQRPVFSQVILPVAPSEFAAIIGEPGVGKSTLLNGTAGLDIWNSGSLVLDGQDLARLNDDQLAHLRREKNRLCVPGLSCAAAFECGSKHGFAIDVAG